MALIGLVFVSLVAGCGSDDQHAAERPSSTPEATDTQTSTPTQSNTLVGRWELSRTCEGMVKALDQAGLRALAPSVAGDYFPDKSPKELARKAEVCQGAEPQQHSHYFTAEGEFGSLDQNGEQVDQQRYRVIDSWRLRIDTEFGPENYDYRIAGGDRLTREPLIPNRAKRAARANPLEFGLAGHMSAVAYTGHTWKRVDCEGWCVSPAAAPRQKQRRGPGWATRPQWTSNRCAARLARPEAVPKHAPGTGAAPGGASPNRAGAR